MFASDSEALQKQIPTMMWTEVTIKSNDFSGEAQTNQALSGSVMIPKPKPKTYTVPRVSIVSSYIRSVRLIHHM
jgi:hypothetical protein